MSGSGSNRQIRRILSIDGGGIKGTMPAAFLAGLEEDLGQPIGCYFDLIAGTSTGYNFNIDGAFYTAPQPI